MDELTMGGPRKRDDHSNPQKEVGKRPKGRPPRGHFWDGLRYVPIGFDTKTSDLESATMIEEMDAVDAELGLEHAKATTARAKKFLGELPVAVRMPRAFEWVFGIPRGLMLTAFQKSIRDYLDRFKDEETGDIVLRRSKLRHLMESGFHGDRPFGPIPIQHKKRMELVLELADLVETIMHDLPEVEEDSDAEQVCETA